MIATHSTHLCEIVKTDRTLCVLGLCISEVVETYYRIYGSPATLGKVVVIALLFIHQYAGFI